jgi:alpha-tubulin suppressor-like RCC1 family protein
VTGDDGLAVRAVSAGHFSTCALTEAGDVRCWGKNYLGVLGIGSMDTGRTQRWPAQVPQLMGPAVQVAVGVQHACAVMYHGGIRCWGSNFSGELGNGIVGSDTGEFSIPEPHDVIQLHQPMVAATAGYRVTCALSRDGEVWCWGALSHDNPPQAVPIRMSGLPPGIRQISGNFRHICALSVDGAVLCWGDNRLGQLANGSTDESWTAVPIAGLQSGVMAISASYGHSCAQRYDGRAFCWGDNEFGQLGDGTVEPRLAPVEVQGLGNSVVSIAAGGAQTCALLTSGELKCWGRNNVGQLGLGFVDGLPHPQPTLVRGLAGPVLSVAMSIGGHPNFDPKGVDSGDEPVDDDEYALGHSCVVLEHGRVQCWGANLYGQLGDGSFTRSPAPGGLFNPIAAVLLPALAR